MIHLLFVCLGNICRSPMAEFVMRDLVAQEGLSHAITVSSAATSNEECGNPVYPPVRKLLRSHGIACDGHAARQLKAQDYDQFDLLIGMEHRNLENMQRICGGDSQQKMHRLLDFTQRPGDVADPYYTLDYESTWRDVNEGCRALLAYLRTQYDLST